MAETKSLQRVARNRKKAAVPLAKLRTSEVVRTVVAHPRRLTELVSLLDDLDRGLRGRAAMTLARLSESHPDRLFRVLDRMRVSLSDDSAFVRWHMAYALGKIGDGFPAKAAAYLADLLQKLEDENPIVRRFALSSVTLLANKRPGMVRQCFQAGKKETPQGLKNILQKAGSAGDK